MIIRRRLPSCPPHPAEPMWGWQVLELAEGVIGSSGVLRAATPLDLPGMWRE